MSSEGSVLPLLGATSSATREAQVIEVVDIPDEEAKTFLSKSMPEDIAKAVVKETGGRFVHLIQAIDVYENNKMDGSSDMMNKTKEHLVGKNVLSKINDSLQEGDFHLKMEIMKMVLSNGSAFPVEVTTELEKKDLHGCKFTVSEIKQGLNQLVGLNLLRYQSNGSLTSHSRLVCNYMKEYMKK